MTIKSSCYEYEEYIFNDSLLDVDATYIIHLIGNGRYESIINQLHKFPISKKVYIVLNKGYKTCKKSISITKPTLDIIDINLDIFNHAKEMKNILILEDDFFFDNKILEIKHQKNINYFIKNKIESEFIYYIGIVPIILLPYDFYNYRPIFGIGAHSVIYSKKFREKTIKTIKKNENLKIKDWDLYLNSSWSRYVYYTPLCYQLFPETENSNHWGDHNFIIYYLAIISKVIIKLLNLDKSPSAYFYIYFLSKIVILLFLIIIWILLIFIISLKM
jgi:hypothetical protein